MKAEQGFCAALQGAFVGETREISTWVTLPESSAMGEPGAPIRSLAQNIGGARRREDAEGEAGGAG